MSRKNKRVINKLAYLATPYTHRLKRMRDARAQAVTLMSATLTLDKLVNYSPITHEAEKRKLMELPHTWGFWRYVDLTFIDHTDEVWVLCLEGFKESTGVSAEIRYAKKTNKPVKYILPTVDKVTGDVYYNFYDTPRGIKAINATRFVKDYKKYSQRSIS